MAQRKAFNFFRSYYDVFNELEKDKDKLQFISALLQRQFEGIEPIELKGMAKFAYISQQFNINSQVKGFEDKTGTKLTDNQASTPPTQGGTEPPTVQEKEKEKEKEKGRREFTPPIIDEVVFYFKENGYTEFSAKKAFRYYDVANWYDSKGNKIKNWKQKMNGVWFKDENIDKSKATKEKNTKLAI